MYYFAVHIRLQNANMHDSQNSLSPEMTFIVVTVILIIGNLPTRVRMDLWKDPLCRAFMIAVPVGVVVPAWQDALAIFLFVWFAVDIISEWHEAESFRHSQTATYNLQLGQ